MIVNLCGFCPVAAIVDVVFQVVKEVDAEVLEIAFQSLEAEVA